MFIDYFVLLYLLSLVEIGTKLAAFAEPLITHLLLIVVLVELEFLPAVTKTAGQPLRTPLAVVRDFLLHFPVHALSCLQGREKGALEILPVVCIDTLVLVVAIFGERTEFRLKEMEEEVFVSRFLVNEMDFDLTLGVCQRAEVPVFALLSVLDVDAELLLVVVWVV